MNFASQKIARHVGLCALALTAGVAQAHTGHGTSGFYEGLAHPLGLDHLLAMVAVGVWSASVLPAKQAWRGPATFMAALVVSAILGAAGFSVPYLEQLISLSVVLVGALLILVRTPVPPTVGLVLIAAAASLHGLAHGAETPDSGFATYALGFLLTTAALHLSGLLAALNLRRYFSKQSPWITQLLGMGCSVAGVYLFSSL